MHMHQHQHHVPNIGPPFGKSIKNMAEVAANPKAMDNEQATSYLNQFIGRNLRIHASDGRVFGGQLKCTDKDRNVILALTHEYRAPSAEMIKKTIEESGNPKAVVTWNSRFVGLVVIPGAHVRKIEFEENLMPGQKSSVTL
ncbi:unnamed protein product [Periconia digitata]|uniref:Sm domain-containing protein n=1 Tax=Periconia digitata TaxID=1303443 RepID=A0A9W4XLZ7_9PLEO|nr:unnamed protein product [Periconia digitata]